MTPDIAALKALCKRLRSQAVGEYGWPGGLFGEAAGAILALLAEREQMARELDDLIRHFADTIDESNYADKRLYLLQHIDRARKLLGGSNG